MDKKKLNLIGIFQVIIMSPFFFTYCYTVFFRSQSNMSKLNYLCGLVLGICFLLHGIYHYKFLNRKKSGIFLVVTSIIMIGLHIIQ